MKKSFLSFFGLLLIVLLFNSCCQSNRCKCRDQWNVITDDCTPHHYGPYPLGGAKDYLYFKPGSYWVYKSNVSGELDTIKNMTCDTFVITSTGNPSRWVSLTYTSMNIWQRSLTYGTDYNYFDYPVTPTTNFNYIFGLWKNANKSEFVAFLYATDQTKQETYSKVIPELKIGDSTYHDVLVFDGGQYDYTAELPRSLGYSVDYAGHPIYYWARGRGLVMVECQLWRYDLKQSFLHRWELHECKLNR